MAKNILISAPSGYNTREILLPLKHLLDNDSDIGKVIVLCPAAEYREQLFSDFGEKYIFYTNPGDLDGHVNMMRESKPDVIITPTIGLDYRDILIVQAGKKIGVPVVTFVASWDNVYKMERLKQKGHSGASKSFGRAYELPDHFAVWNKINQKHIQSVFPDFKESDITITGPPRFDYFAHEENIPSKQELFDYLDINKSAEDTHLLHCATTELYPFEYIIKKLSSSKVAERNIHFYASVHPGGDIDNHKHYEKYGATVRYSFGRRVKALHKNFAYLPTEEEIYMLVSLFKHSSVLVNQSSTVAIESMRCDVPVVNVKYGKRFDWLRWYRSMVYRDFGQHYKNITSNDGTSVTVKPAELVEEVDSYLDNPERKHKERVITTKKLLTYTDGGCGQRLVDLAKRF